MAILSVFFSILDHSAEAIDRVSESSPSINSKMDNGMSKNENNFIIGIKTVSCPNGRQEIAKKKQKSHTSRRRNSEKMENFKMADARTKTA